MSQKKIYLKRRIEYDGIVSLRRFGNCCKEVIVQRVVA